jgi:hypothetical protein
MAFNPFHAFRKHQKVIFAGLTIMCMVTFVFCGSGLVGLGRQDYLTEIMIWLGLNKGGWGSVKVAKVYGSTVKARDLDELRKQRWYANQAMMNLMYQAAGAIELEATDAAGLNPKSKDKNKTADKFSDKLGMMMAIGPALTRMRQRQSTYAALMALQGPDGLADYKRTITRDANDLQAKYNELRGKAQTEEARLVRDVMMLVGFQGWAVLSRFRPELYFGGDLSPEDLLDFMMWRKVADKLGIKLTRESVVKLLNDETLNRSPVLLTGKGKDDALLRDWLRMSRINLTPDQFYDALIDEFRVAFAKAAVLGTEPGARAFRFPQAGLDTSPVAVTPDDLWRFYEKNQTVLKVAMLPVPASKFHTHDKPTDADIKSWYNQYKDAEPAPDRPTPGFRAPTRARIQWVSLNAQSPFYQTAARQDIEKKQAADRLSLALAATPGTGLQAVGFLGLAGKPELALQIAYAQYHKDQTENWTTSGINPGFVHDTSRLSPTALTRTLGSLLAFGSSGAPASLAQGDQVWEDAARDQETVARVRIGGVHKLLARSPVPILPTSLIEAATPRPLPFSAVRDLLIEKQRQEVQTRARQLAREDMERVRQNLEAANGDPRKGRDVVFRDILWPRQQVQIGGVLASAGLGPMHTLPYLMLRPDQAPLANVGAIRFGKPGTAQAVHASAAIGLGAASPLGAAAFVASKPLPQEALVQRSGFFDLHTTGLRHRYDVAKSPAMRDFLRLYRAEKPGDRNLTDFGTLFFGPMQNRLYTPGEWPTANWQQPGRDVEEPVLFWKSEEQKTDTPPLDKVRREVVAAWRRQKERDLARQEAERVAAELKKQTPQDRVRRLRDIAGSHSWGSVFQVDGISRLEKPRSPLPPVPGHPETFRPYKLPDSYREDFEYPPSDLVDQLLDRLREPGDVAVIADRPRDMYYIVVLEQRAAPEKEKLASLYSPDDQQLWDMLRAERQTAHRNQVLKQLRIEAGLLDADGEPTFTISEELRRTLESRTRDSE